MAYTVSGVGSNSSAGTDTSDTSKTKTGGLDALAQKDTFLRLLVAQIKNQDPLNPSDGIQFVSQLAQFSELEQVMQIRADLETLAARAAESAAGSDETKESQNV